MNLKNIQIPTIHLIIGRFFGRFHVITFTIVVLGGLAVVTYKINQIVTSSTETQSTDAVNQQLPEFDAATIERINSLTQDTSSIKTLEFPKNKRPDPFWE